MKRIVFFGDSICVGQFVSPHLTWVTRVSGKMSDEFRADLWINNASHSGDTSRIGLERMAFDVTSHGVDLILIQFGINDCNYWKTDNGHPRVSAEAFRFNLVEMIARARSAGAGAVLLNTNHPTPRTEPLEGGGMNISCQASNEQYNAVIRDVATQTNSELIDIELMWKVLMVNHVEAPPMLLSDHVHLSRAGHDFYFKAVYPVISAAFRKLLGVAHD